MKALLLLLIASLMSLQSFAQHTDSLSSDSIKSIRKVLLYECVDFPDVLSSFPGGEEAWNNWLNENIQYPEVARERREQGTVYVSFVVETDGSIMYVETKNSISAELDREAIRLMKSMPKWNAALIKGKLVRSRCQVPIRFSLQ